MAFVSYTWWEYDSYKIHCFLTFYVVDTVQPLKILTKNGAMHNTTMIGHYEDAEKKTGVKCLGMNLIWCRQSLLWGYQYALK